MGTIRSTLALPVPTHMRRSMKQILLVLLFTASLVLPRPAAALTPEVSGKIDTIVREVLAATGGPSASIAVVQDGRIAYLQAYGDARLEPRRPARPGMRYAIGSVSKQFTAAAILILAEQGKLSLDDPVSRFIPDLTRADDIKIRQLLSHTSGYQDYWPQDYVPPFMLKPISADQLLDRWARKPLDFEPGTDWQYSNTGYVAAGLIVERASGEPLFGFLTRHIFTPLGMTSPVNQDEGPLTEPDAKGYTRHGLGPLRVARKEGSGWLFGAGGLAMTAEDLAKWDISLIDQTLLKPASYHEMESALILKNGTASTYGLGLAVTRTASSRSVAHGGEVSGFTAQNTIYPDDRVAVVVLANQDAGEATGDIARKVAPLLFPKEEVSKEEEQVGRIFAGLQRGKIDRALFSENGNFYFSETALKDLAKGLKPLGKPKSLHQTNRNERGGMTFRLFEVKFRNKTLHISQRTLPDGKIEQFQVIAAE